MHSCVPSVAAVAEYRAAESARLKDDAERAAANLENSVSGARSADEIAGAPICPEGAPTPSGVTLPIETTEDPKPSPVLAISSGGQVLVKTGAPGLTFEEKFKLASRSSMIFEAVHEQVKEGITSLLQHAASQTAEAQQIISSALAAAASAVGVEAEQQSMATEVLPPADVSLHPLRTAF